jgi:GH15 family glucan-1,4-alpha-glucosidase
MLIMRLEEALPPIGEYGLIGDTRTAALVGLGGSIDWLCFPRFDSPPLFGKLVAGEEGGSFQVGPTEALETEQRYLDGSSVIETSWRTGTGEATLLDGMVADTGESLLPQALIVRELTCRSGAVRARVRFDPRRGWTWKRPRAERRQGRLVCAWGPIVATLAVAPDLALEPGEDREVELRQGDRLVLALGLDERSPAVLVDPLDAIDRLEATDRWWRAWTAGLESPIGDFDAAVRRSLITLRLLTYAPSGAPVAAPTTSLPEIVGGSRNWDYRYAWVRDASLGASAFLSAGSTSEPRSFLWWMLHASRRTRPELRVLYDLMGGANFEERELPDLPGYRGSRPVRVGNAAVDQFQLDAYAWMIDAGCAYLERTGRLYAETWRALRGHADVLARRWMEPDSGIWELRETRRHYVHSKLMAWHGLDRALQMAERLPATERRKRSWTIARSQLADEIRRRGFDESRNRYLQAFDSTGPDASILGAAMTRFEPRDSPRLDGTIDAIRSELGAGGPLLYRTVPDGEGAFLPCSFWLSSALAAGGRVEEAREVFAQTCALASPLGLFAEELDPTTKEHLGNFPQAFTHSSLVLAVADLARAEGEIKGGGTNRGSRRTRRARRS